jgi:hypothetical protein
MKGSCHRGTRRSRKVVFAELLLKSSLTIEELENQEVAFAELLLESSTGN